MNRILLNSVDYQVKLELFEGPLDLLLQLIKKNEINIYDIPIAKIAEQYLEHLEMVKTLDLEWTGEFLVIVSTLVYLKSEMLLPEEERDYAELVEEEDIRQELVQKILEYQQFKEMASWLEKLEEKQKDIFGRKIEAPRELYMEANLFQLLSSLERVMVKPSPVSFHEVSSEGINIAQKMEELMSLSVLNEVINFNELIQRNYSRKEIIALFLALLELMRLRKVKAYQLGKRGEIWIRWR